ncbi:MAG: glycosyltransferase family 61 protein [Reyranellaceae bacterium]
MIKPSAAPPLESYEAILDALEAAFPDRLRCQPDGRLAQRGTLRLASEALVERLEAAGASLAVQGKVPSPKAILEALLSLPRTALGRHGLLLPLPPEELVADRVAAQLGVDLAAADAVADTLWEAGLEFLATGRWLYLDCRCGLAIRGLQLAMPKVDWLGLARGRAAVAWAGRHVATARFAPLPARPPIAEADGSFDGVVALTLGDVGDRAVIDSWVTEIARLVAPGGVAVIATRGFGVLADLATRRLAPAAELAEAYRALAAGENPTVRRDGRVVRLQSAHGLSLHRLGDGWRAMPPRVSAGPGRKDIHVVRRLPERHIEPDTRFEIDGAVDASNLAAGRRKGGLIDATCIVPASSVARRPPVFVDSASVSRLPRRLLAMVMASDRCAIPERHLLRLRDALVTGQGTVVLRDAQGHRLLRDSAYEFLAFGIAPPGLRGSVQKLRFSMPRHIDRRLDGCSLLLKRPWAGNFGHWLVDHAMTLSYLVKTGALPTRQIVVDKVRKRSLRQVMRQTIAAVLPDAVVHEHDTRETWAFEELAYAMPLHVPAILKPSAALLLRKPRDALASFKLPAAMACLRADLLGPSASAPGGSRPRRLRVVRPAAFARELVNEPEIAALTERYGFETVVPETLSMREQATLFASAEAVIGVKGAALTNIIFAPESCHLIVLSPSDFIDMFFWDIASVLGIGYSEIFGTLAAADKPVGRNPFAVSPASLERVLKRHLAG